MSRDDDLRIRPGRSRADAGPDIGSALRQVRVAVARAGGVRSGRTADGTTRRSGAFGRGQAAAVRQLHGGARRRVIVKARVARRSAGGLVAHLGYLQRDGAGRDGEAGRLFDADGAADAGAFLQRADEDRHQFRFIVSPEDAVELGDLRAYTRDLMTGMERDLAARLDWVAVDHWNTAHPHVHIVVRGRLEDGADLVISRDYISRGLRARAEALADLELGPPNLQDHARRLARDIEADHYTPLDRALERRAGADRLVDLRAGGAADGRALAPLIARVRTLERRGLAKAEGRGRWRLTVDLPGRLRARARETEVSGRLADAVKARGLARAPEQLTAASLSEPLIGRVLARGLDDELSGTGFAVIDGLDGRVRHITLPDAGAPEPRVDAIIRATPPSRGAHPMTLTASDFSLEAQVSASGSTWLDRRLLSPARPVDVGGFASEVAAALEARVDHLCSEGLARRRADGVRFAPGLLDTLRDRELREAADRISAETGLIVRPAPADGEAVEGVYRRRLDLASGRVAMIEDGAGFSLVPWRPGLDAQRGRSVTGLAGPGGAIEWRPARTPGR